MSAFSIPLSGLAASSASLNVIANNLANLNTDGYKDQSLNFADVFNQMQGVSGNGNPIQVGSGVRIGGQNSKFTNGSVNSTGVDSNMALQGNGFFVVSDKNHVGYTRAGNFSVNDSGQITTPGGELVMGYPATGGVVSTSSALAPISVNQAGNIAATPTSSFQMNANLDSTAPVGTIYNSPITIYDSLGGSHIMNVQFTNTAPKTWSYSISIPSADTGGTGTPTPVSTGTLQFNQNGTLTSPTGSIPSINIGNLADGAAPMSLAWNLNTSAVTPSITQQDAISATTTSTQNGFGVGTLTGYSVLADGTVQGKFSNDQTQVLGQVAIASFANVQGLTQTGGNDYQASMASGAAVLGQAGAGGNGAITGGAVEGSNVDLATEFAHLIVAQQGYQANAKVVTTLNQVSQATLQMIA